MTWTSAECFARRCEMRAFELLLHQGGWQYWHLACYTTGNDTGGPVGRGRMVQLKTWLAWSTAHKRTSSVDILKKVNMLMESVLKVTRKRAKWEQKLLLWSLESGSHSFDFFLPSTSSSFQFSCLLSVFICSSALKVMPLCRTGVRSQIRSDQNKIWSFCSTHGCMLLLAYGQDN